ncbi:MAG: hypothetical protein ACPL7E_03195, partial [bacterium]
MRFGKFLIFVGVVLLLMGKSALGYTVTGVQLHLWRGGPGAPHEFGDGSTIKGFFGLFHLVIGVYQSIDEPPVIVGCSYIELWEGSQLLTHVDNPSSSVQCINPPPGSNKVWTFDGGLYVPQRTKPTTFTVKAGYWITQYKPYPPPPPPPPIQTIQGSFTFIPIPTPPPDE